MKSIGKLNTLGEITFTQTKVATWLPDLLKISVSSGQVPHVTGHLSYAHGMMSQANSSSIPFSAHSGASWHEFWGDVSVSSGQVPHVTGHLSYAHGMMSHANSFSIPFSAHSGASWHVFWEEAPSRLSLFTESEAVSLQISGSASGTGSLVTVVIHILERMHYRMCKINTVWKISPTTILHFTTCKRFFAGFPSKTGFTKTIKPIFVDIYITTSSILARSRCTEVLWRYNMWICMCPG